VSIRSKGKFCDCEEIDQKPSPLDHIKSEMDPADITHFLQDPFNYKPPLAFLCLSGFLTSIIC
jgi:hypothetical protein